MLIMKKNTGLAIAQAAFPLIDRWLMLLAAFPGVVLAVWIYGPALNPSHVEWLLAEGDSLQHFSGWDMFRRDEWRWPLGALPTLGSQVGASIVYTDSMPLIAIPLKLFHAWLPDPLQYIAPVMLVNLALNGAVAAGLLRWLGCGRCVALAGSLLVVSLPMVTMRGPGALGHEALSSHWLIIMAMWLFLVPQARWAHALRWLALLAAAVAVHFYLFFMVGVLWFAWWVLCVWSHWGRRNDLVRLLAIAPVTVIAVLASMYAIGYFEFGLDVEGDTGFGLYSSELLGFFNPGSAALFFQGEHFNGVSRLFSGWRSPVVGQYEGFAYAGAGVLLLWAMALLGMWVSRSLPLAPIERCLLAPLVLLFVFSLSHHVVIGQWQLSLPFPAWTELLTHQLRSSGRMAWPLLYGLLFAALIVASRCSMARWLGPVLGVVLLVQVWDVSPWQYYVKHQVSRLAPGESIARPFSWREEPQVVALLEQSHEIRLLPGDDWYRVNAVSWLAARYDLVSNVAYFARTNPGLLYAAASEQRKALEAGQIEAGVLYALTEASLVEIACGADKVACYTVDGMTLALKPAEF